MHPPTSRTATLAGLVLAVALCTLLVYRIVRAESPAAKLGSGPPLVFIHGIKGSVLAKPDGDTHWLTPWQVLGLGTRPLALPLEWQGAVQATDDLQPAGILESIRLIPYLVEQEVYGGWMREARALGRPFY